ncbi:T9SS type A sorting domain-containing protein [Carboxylicivirga taeanensis]|uniref:T9SS type A sorting domain-containing protein n=1 Tax=Carboxylicivirga taeanensis TaxID=1416875 RepID=UPI003F6DEA3D
MKNFFTLLTAVVISCTASAQNLKVNKLWDHSVHGTADWSGGFPNGGNVPAWMGNLTERGMAHFDGKLYIPSRHSNTIIVLDALTGNKVKEIGIDASITGGTYAFNDIVMTDNGDIVLANLTTASTKSPFQVYVLSDDGTGNYTKVNKIIEWTSPAGTEETPEPEFRIGDGIGVYGDVINGNGYVVAANNAIPARVFRWDVTDGVVTADPVVFDVQTVLPAVDPGKAPKIGLAPKFWPVSNDYLYIDGHSIMPGLYDMSGNMISSFDVEGVLPKTSGISGISAFSFKGKEYLWLATTNHVAEPKAAFELFEVPTSGLASAVSLGVYPENGLGTNTNASYMAPVAFDVQLNKVLLFCLSPNNGVAAFELVEDAATSVDKNERGGLRMYPNPATDVINFTEEVVEVQLMDMAGKVVLRSNNVQELSLVGLKGFYIIKATSQTGAQLVEKLIVR